MSLGTRDEIINFISNSGATLFDLAATYESTPEEVAIALGKMDIQLPSMNFEGPFDFIKGLHRGIGITDGCSAKELINDPFGGVQHLPKGRNGMYLSNIGLIYKSVHGDQFVDSYTGKEVTEKDLVYVDGNAENFLVTNVEAISESTWDARFKHPIGLTQETFKFNTRYFNVELSLGRKYDQLVGGTYNPEYVHQLFCTWVGYPLNLYFKRNAEEETIFKHKNPTFIAWWMWAQLSNYAFLKGIQSITVTSTDIRSMDQFSSTKLATAPRSLAPATMQHSAVLTNTDVLFALKSIIEDSQAKTIISMAKDNETTK